MEFNPFKNKFRREVPSNEIPSDEEIVADTKRKQGLAMAGIAGLVGAAGILELEPVHNHGDTISSTEPTPVVAQASPEILSQVAQPESNPEPITIPDQSKQTYERKP